MSNSRSAQKWINEFHRERMKKDEENMKFNSQCIMHVNRDDEYEINEKKKHTIFLEK